MGRYNFLFGILHTLLTISVTWVLESLLNEQTSGLLQVYGVPPEGDDQQSSNNIWFSRI